MRRFAVRIAVMTTLAVAPMLHAQDVPPPGRVLLTGGAVLGVLDHRVDVGAGVERTSGPVFGIQLDASRGPELSVALRALGGTLDARSGGIEARDVGEVQADARLHVRPWLDARAGATVRSFTSELARQRWTQLSLGADTRIAMLDGRIVGTAGAALLPYVRISGHDSPGLAIAASMGLRYSNRRIDIGLAYALERYDFAVAAGVRRTEEHSSLVIRAGYRLGIGR